MTYPPLTEVDRNRMLAQRELLWASEQKAAANVVGLLDTDVNYRMLTNVIANYLWATILLWGFDNDNHKTVIEKALKSEDSLAIWGNSSADLETINTWLSRGRKWSISELSQLMRLFVVVLEVIDQNIDDNTQPDFNRIDPRNLKMMLLESSNYVFKGDDLRRFNSNYQLINLAETIADEEQSGARISRWKALVRKVKKVT
ncbi:MAG: hypothetical protein OQK04_11075, partial [Kangiellaceae bacterium]|nr:hypothetical protein [Kangiellaceae bacterium]